MKIYSPKKRAIITGIGGQDGGFLSSFLLKKDYQVIGIARRSSVSNEVRFKHLPAEVVIEQGDVTDSLSLLRLLKQYQPDELYNLAAQSFVKASFDEPSHTFQVNAQGCLNCLEAIREISPHTKFYQATSSEIFGSAYSIQTSPIKRGITIDSRKEKIIGGEYRIYQDEETTPLPCSQYGVSKLAAHAFVKVYREMGLFACSGILFNHESERRGFEFVTRKISRYVAGLKLGKQKFKLDLGNLDAYRDWGYAGDYVEAMWLILQYDKADDYVVATGKTHSIREFLIEAFNLIGETDWEKHIWINKDLFRPSEVNLLKGDYSKIKQVLGWMPKTSFKELVKLMVENDIRELSCN
jgi:GDPmannose 4,6-dehydratase